MTILAHYSLRDLTQQGNAKDAPMPHHLAGLHAGTRYPKRWFKASDDELRPARWEVFYL